MEITLNKIIKEACNLPLIPLAGATIYQEKIPHMEKYVNNAMASNPSINELIGNNPLQILYDNHHNHAAFMSTVFLVGNYELLARTIPWVYKSYSAHNFSKDYFPLVLHTWIEALEKHISSEMTTEIKSIYDWLINNHENMIYLSQADIEMKIPIRKDWLERKNAFLSAILEGNHKKCLDIATDFMSTENNIEAFYFNILQPVMYEVGMLWERGTISVAQEHLASAIVSRVMASTSILDMNLEKVAKKAVITSAPNEFHEIGAWMISDILEHEGWEVRYLGANTPKNELLELVRSFQPQVLALSVTMPFNILKAKEIVNSIKADEDLKKTKIIVGGRAFNETENLWKSTGADYFAANVQEIKSLQLNME